MTNHWERPGWGPGHRAYYWMLAFPAAPDLVVRSPVVVVIAHCRTEPVVASGSLAGKAVGAGTAGFIVRVSCSWSFGEIGWQRGAHGGQRLPYLAARKANPVFHFAEALWYLAGRRDLLYSAVDLRSDMTVGEWLDSWLNAKKTRRTTTRGYASHIENHLKPRIGHIRLDRLNVGHIQEMFDAIKDHNEVILAENSARRAQVARCTPGKPGAPTAGERTRLAAKRAALAKMPPYRLVTGAATRQRIRSTLRAALNAAIARQLIIFNAAEHVELDSGRRPKPLLWTDERVRRWQETGEIPGRVMVWMPPQLGVFLDEAADDRLYAAFHLIAFRGLRRGEAVGQEWVDIDLEAGLLTPAKEIVQDGWTPYESAPKTDGSASPIHIDSLTVRVLRLHRARQRKERLSWGRSWQNSGKVFTQEDGSPLHPEMLSDAFRRVRRATNLPPINLRDLRHVAATLAHAGGGDLHTIKEMLRHSTITLTSDTYTSLLPEVDRAVAERAARIVPRARPIGGGGAPGLTPGSQGLPATPKGSPGTARETAFPQVEAAGSGVPRGGAGGTRTHDRRIMSPLL